MDDSSFGYKQPKDSPGLLLWQTTTLWQKKIKAELDQHGMTHSQFVILAITSWLCENGIQATQVEMAKMSKMEKMTVSKALKELTTHGYIKRKEHKTDTRAKVVTITTKGTQKITTLVPKIEAIDEKFFSCLGKKGRTSLISSFCSLVDHHSAAHSNS